MRLPGSVAIWWDTRICQPHWGLFSTHEPLVWGPATALMRTHLPSVWGPPLHWSGHICPLCEARHCTDQDTSALCVRPAIRFTITPCLCLLRPVYSNRLFIRFTITPCLCLLLSPRYYWQKISMYCWNRIFMKTGFSSWIVNIRTLTLATGTPTRGSLIVYLLLRVRPPVGRWSFTYCYGCAPGGSLIVTYCYMYAHRWITDRLPVVTGTPTGGSLIVYLLLWLRPPVDHWSLPFAMGTPTGGSLIVYILLRVRPPVGHWSLPIATGAPTVGSQIVYILLRVRPPVDHWSLPIATGTPTGGSLIFYLLLRVRPPMGHWSFTHCYGCAHLWVTDRLPIATGAPTGESLIVYPLLRVRPPVGHGSFTYHAGVPKVFGLGKACSPELLYPSSVGSGVIYVNI